MVMFITAVVIAASAASILVIFLSRWNPYYWLVKSALLLGGLWAEGRTTVRSPGPSRDHTERMLRAMGVPVETDGERLVASLDGPAALQPVDLDVPGDFSSAAFFLVAGCLGARDGLLIRDVGVNPTRIGLLTVLDAMGARVELRNGCLNRDRAARGRCRIRRAASEAGAGRSCRFV